MRRIPLRRRDGTIRAYALVDDEDYGRVKDRRWSIGATGGYVMCQATRTYLHRELLGLRDGDRREGDHKDGDKLNCTRGNLRIVTPQINRQNQRSRRGSSSRFRGVRWHAKRQKWIASVMVNGRYVLQRWFTDELEAAVAAERVRLECMPGALPTPELVGLV